MDQEKVRLIALGSLGVILFISFFLIGFSVTVLEPLNYGLEINEKTVTLDTSKVWYSGRYWQGLGMNYIKFPIQQQIVIFSDSIKAEKGSRAGAKFAETDQILDSITCRSKEGITLKMDIFMAYRLTTSADDKIKAKQLSEIHSKYGLNWNNFIQIIIHSEVRNVASKYEAFDYFKKREIIGNDMFNSIKRSLEEFHFNLINIFIINLQFPTLFETAILKTQIVVQNTQTTTYIKESKEIEAETRRLEAEIQKTIVIETQTANADASYINKVAVANSTRIEIDKQREALEYLKKQIGFKDEGANTAANKMLTYLWIYNVKSYPNTTRINLAMNVPSGLKI